MIVYYKCMRRKDESKRLAIMEASIDLINEIGLAQASMSKIAKKANVSPSTIYIYFENKEELLNSLYLMTKEKMSREILIDINENLDIKEFFIKVCNNIFTYVRYNPRQYLFSEQFSNSPLIKKISQDKVESYFKPVFEMLEKGKKQGLLKNYPTELLVMCGMMPILYLAKVNTDKEEIDSILISQAIDIAWDGISTH